MRAVPFTCLKWIAKQEHQSLKSVTIGYKPLLCKSLEGPCMTFWRFGIIWHPMFKEKLRFSPKLFQNVHYFCLSVEWVCFQIKLRLFTYSYNTWKYCAFFSFLMFRMWKQDIRNALVGIWNPVSLCMGREVSSGALAIVEGQLPSTWLCVKLCKIPMERV